MSPQTLLMISVVITTVILGISAYTFLTGGDSPPKGKPPKKEEEAGPSGEESLGMFYVFGFVDDTPNVIRQIVAGPKKTGRPIRYIDNLERGIADPVTGDVTWLPDGVMKTEPDEGPLLNFIRQNFGLRWYGVPFIHNTKAINIDRVVFNKTNTDDGEQTLLDQLSSSTEVRYGLYGEILRPTYHADVDANDNIRFSTTSLTRLRVTKASVAFNIHPHDFLILVSKTIGNYFSRHAIRDTYEAYKRGGNVVTPEQIGEINTMLQNLGIQVVEINFEDPELNKGIQTAMEEKAKAEQKKLARIEEAKGEKEYLIQTYTGKAQGIEMLAKAEAKRPAEMIRVYRENGVPGETAVHMANKMVVAELQSTAIAEHKGAFAPGSGVNIALLEGQDDDEREDPPRIIAPGASSQTAPPPQNPQRPKGNRKNRGGGRRGH